MSRGFFRCFEEIAESGAMIGGVRDVFLRAWGSFFADNHRFAPIDAELVWFSAIIKYPVWAVRCLMYIKEGSYSMRDNWALGVNGVFQVPPHRY